MRGGESGSFYIGQTRRLVGLAVLGVAALRADALADSRRAIAAYDAIPRLDLARTLKRTELVILCPNVRCSDLRTKRRTRTFSS